MVGRNHPDAALLPISPGSQGRSAGGGRPTQGSSYATVSSVAQQRGGRCALVKSQDPSSYFPILGRRDRGHRETTKRPERGIGIEKESAVCFAERIRNYSCHIPAKLA